jgi:HD-GYP domain-containing protein (c-di-GMP phosphodiesterase class II)
MTTTRSYRKAMPPEKALSELRSCAGTQFDPRVAEALEAIVGS